MLVWLSCTKRLGPKSKSWNDITQYLNKTTLKIRNTVLNKFSSTRNMINESRRSWKWRRSSSSCETKTVTYEKIPGEKPDIMLSLTEAASTHNAFYPAEARQRVLEKKDAIRIVKAEVTELATIERA